MPLLLLVSQQLQSFYLQDMRRAPSSGQMSVWQRGNEVRSLPPSPRIDRGRLGTSALLQRQTCLTNHSSQGRTFKLLLSAICGSLLKYPPHTPGNSSRVSNSHAQCPVARLACVELVQGWERRAGTAGKKSEVMCVGFGEKRE